MNPSTSVLLTDLYELTMAQAYLEQGMDKPAVFEFFVRKLPAHRNFLVAAGLEQVLDYLSTLRVTQEELAWLDQSGQCSRRFLHRHKLAQSLRAATHIGQVDFLARRHMALAAQHVPGFERNGCGGCAGAHQKFAA